jgi:hypothetical protein
VNVELDANGPEDDALSDEDTLTFVSGALRAD